MKRCFKYIISLVACILAILSGFFLLKLMIYRDKYDAYSKFDRTKIVEPVNLAYFRKRITYNLHLKDTRTVHTSFNHELKIKNVDGMCYFNVIIQALIANTLFFETIIMTNFHKKAIVLRILQIIICKVLHYEVADISKELGYLQEIVNVSGMFNTMGGNPLDVLKYLNDYIDKEIIDNNYENLYDKLSHSITISTIQKCSRCNYYKEIITKTNLIEKINQSKYPIARMYTRNHIDIVEGSNTHFCKFLFPRTHSVTINVALPSTICLKLPFVCDLGQKIEPDSKYIPLQIIIVDGIKFRLCAIVFFLYQKANPHAAVLVLKDNNWYFSSDEECYKLQTLQSNLKNFKSSRMVFYSKE